MITQHEIRAGAYYDSVILMQLQSALAALPAIDDAGVVMATEANLDLLAATGLLPDGLTPSPDDLLIVVKGADETAVSDAISQVDDLLRKRRGTASADFAPKSLDSALKAQPDAEWVLISTPGRYAAAVARDALNADKHVFLYSDNVSIADELSLKQLAQEKGRLMMGPDCGTAVINGIGLGFANRVRRGHIGIIAASGTGLQAVAVEVHNLGGGVSQAIGTGGRDLKEAIGGITAMQALNALAQDDETGVIVLISKPPSATVATKLLQAAQHAGKPVVVNFIGYAPPGRLLGNLLFSNNLTDAAERAVVMCREGEMGFVEERRPLRGYVRGLFSGGTLAYEMLLGLQSILTPVYSNLSADPAQTLADPAISIAHTIVDMGEDYFTQGRLHPMMDNDLRLRRLQQEAADEDVDMIVLDVVLGEGSHPDPAAELAPAIANAKRAGKRVVAIVVGTEDDPQGLDGQIERLVAAGAHVFPNVNEALDYVYNRVPAPIAPAVELAALGGDGVTAVNIGLESFAESIRAQGGTAVHVDWRPPAGGNAKLAALLAMMKTK